MNVMNSGMSEIVRTFAACFLNIMNMKKELLATVLISMILTAKI